MNTTRVECSCKVCKVNAAKIGKSLPLAANVPTTLYVCLPGTRAAHHGVVYTANDPSSVGAAARKRTNITAA